MKSIYLYVMLAALVAGCGSGSDNDRSAGNRAPSVSAIGDQSIQANRSDEQIFFTVSDEDVASLDIESSSDQQQIVADENLAILGSGSERRLSVTPTRDSSGEVTISIVVTDRQGLSANTVFALSVVPERVSIQQFARSTFPEEADDEPELVNAVEFVQDADEDDFSDLIPD